jgi:ribonuclease D
MATQKTPYTLIEQDADLEHFGEQHRQVEWLCFDTEFVGEKRFVTLICLIQVASPHGFFLIDPLKVKNLEPFLALIRNPAILKITHAGENDYRLLYQNLQTLPANIFDTQVAAAFVGYKYPTSFGRLVEGELGVDLGKGYAVADWQSRPFSNKQLDYAIDDVRYLHQLWKSLVSKLNERGRFAWTQEECNVFTQADFYDRDPNHEALHSDLMRHLKPREQVFLLRLFAWRTDEARRLNYSKEMILPSKLISMIVRTVRSGKSALHENRRLPDRTIEKHGDRFLQMYEMPATPEEKELLKRLPKSRSDDPEEEIILFMLDLLIRYKSQQSDLPHHVVLPRNLWKQIQAEPGTLPDALETGWRREFLGEELLQWLRQHQQLELDFGAGSFELKLKDL